ncbi:MAG TPA: hypothetical protein VFB38_22265 [Chthonomonadaceae bacterium]|nr:hypothetical protein [Chthonomonadaceae bacterium]
MRSLLVLLMIIGLATAAGAQEQPDGKEGSNGKTSGSQQKPAGEQKPAGNQAPAGKGQPPQQPKPARPGEEEEEEVPEEEAAKPPPRVFPWRLGLGWVNWYLSGNETKFRQYATPPRGFFLYDWRYNSLSIAHGNSGFLALNGPGTDDYRGDADLAFFFGRTRLEGWFTRNRFFDPTPTLVPESGRNIQDIALRQFLIRDFSLAFRFQQNKQNQFFEAPHIPLDQRTRYMDAIAAGRLGNGQLRLSYADRVFTDYTGTYPETDIGRVQLRYLWQPTLNFGLEGTVAHFDIHQAGAPRSRADVLSLAGSWALGPSSDLAFLLERDRMSLPVVQNAQMREQRLATLRFAQRWRRWALQLGLQEREVERVNADQTFVDVPRWFTFDGRLSGRLNRQWRLTLRGYTENLNHALTMLTQDPRSLYWDSRDFVQAKLEGGLPNLSGYMIWSYRHWSNDARSSRVTMNAFLVGGNWQVSPRGSLFLEYGTEAWGGHTDILEFPTLGNFTPSNRTFAAGASWAIGASGTLALNFTDFSTRNDNPLLLRDGNTHGQFFTLSASYRFPRGQELGITISPWTYQDRVVSTMDYDATILMLTASARF